MKKISKIFSSALLVIFGAILVHPLAVSAEDSGGSGGNTQTINQICEQAPDSTVCDALKKGNEGNDPVGGEQGIFRKVFDVLSIIAGIIAVILIIVGGIQMMTSNGDPQKFSTAKNIIIYTSVGVVIVASSQLIVKFVLLRLI